MLRRRDFLVATGFALAVAVVAFLLVRPGGSERAYAGSAPAVASDLPEFALRDVDAAPVRTQGLLGKAVAVTFLDTQCTLACPIIAGVVGRALDDLGGTGAVAVAFSVDPAEDTDEAVRGFLDKHRARGKLLYVNAPADELRRLWKRFQVLSSEESGSDTLHSAPVRVYDANGVWVSTLHAGADLTVEALAHDLRVAAG